MKGKISTSKTLIIIALIQTFLPITCNTTLNIIQQKKLWAESTPLKLHLGCGQTHFKGYVNIDFPPSQHTVQNSSPADLYADLTTLNFPNLTVDEIRSHHVFEHFNRPAALALLCKWQQWLKIGGKLIIETPDFHTSIKMLDSSKYTYKEKQVILRHIFGSHEAQWAVHWDGWYQEKYEHILKALGFDDIQFELTHWKLTHNIIVSVTKTNVVNLTQLKLAAQYILSESLVDSSEQTLLLTWYNEFENVLDLNSI